MKQYPKWKHNPRWANYEWRIKPLFVVFLGSEGSDYGKFHRTYIVQGDVLVQTIRQFPLDLEYVNRDVAEVFLSLPFSREDLDLEEQAEVEGLDGFGKSYDFYVRLKDGRQYGFTAFTPEAMRENMNNEHRLSFVTSGLVVVSEISVEALLSALDSCLRWTKYYPLDHFGFPESGELY